MTWNTVCPDPSLSVAANIPKWQQNTTYTKTLMNRDHFWDTGTNYDGHHNAIQSPKQASDPVLSAGIDGALYLKEVSPSNNRVQGFFKTNSGVYQYIPSFDSGTVDLTTTNWVTVTNIPDNSYGQVYIFLNSITASPYTMQFGTFRSVSGYVEGYASEGPNTTQVPIILGNLLNISGLALRCKRSLAPAGIYQYRIVYWGT